MKKFISLALAVVMILLACPLAIFAADNVIDLQVTENGTTKVKGSYATLDAAFAALDTLYDGVTGAATTEALYEAAGKPVLKLTGNLSAAASTIPWNNTTDIDGKAVRTVVIDGTNPSATKREENFAISYSGNGYLITNIAICNLTVKNVNFNLSGTGGDGKFAWGGSGIVEQIEVTAIFENCIINDRFPNGTANQGGIFKLNGKKKANIVGAFGDSVTGDIFNLTLKDCYIFEEGAQSLQVHWGADANITLENTTWIHDSEKTSNGNHSIIKAYECGDITVRIDGTSVLESRVASSYSSLIHALQTIHEDNRFDVYLAEGATLYLNDAAKSNNYFILNQTSNLKVYDEGAIWKIAPTAASGIVGLPSWMGETGMIAWKNGTENLGTANLTKTVTEPLLLTHYELDPTTQGYAVYVTDSKNTTVKAYYKTLEETYGRVPNGATVHLMKDVTKTSADVKPAPDGFTVTIDGTKATDAEGNVTDRYKLTQTSAYTFEVGNCNFTLSNVILNATKGLRFHANDTNNYSFTTNVENVDMTLTGGIGFKIGQSVTNTGSRTYTINITNSNITSNAADTVFYGADIAKYDINIHNTDITRTKGAGSGNGFIFNMFNKLGGTIDVTGDSSLNVKNDTANSCGMFYTHATGFTNPITVTLGSDVEMNLLSSTTTSGDTGYFLNTAAGGVIVVDKGAVYSASKQVAALGVYIPAVAPTTIVKDGVTYENVTFNRYYGDTMVPSSTYTKLSGSDSGARTKFYIPDATGTVTYENRFIAPEVYGEDKNVAILRKDAEGKVIKTYTYGQISNALTDVANGETLVLLRDIYTTGAYMGQNPKTASYTIDGQGKYGIIQANQTGNYLLYAPIGTVTIKDATLNINGGFWFEKGGDQNVVLDNVSMTSGSARAWVAFRTKAGDYNVTAINGTTVTTYHQISANVKGDRVVFDDSTLRVETTTAAVSSAANCGLTFINGAELVIPERILKSAGDDGYTLPTVTDTMGNAIPWVIDGAISTATKYTNASATADASLKPLTSYFDTLTGASIRTEDPAGIRFAGTFSDELLAMEGVQVGLIVTKYDESLTAENFTIEAMTAAGRKFINQAGENGKFLEDGDENQLRVALVNLAEAAYDMQLCARAYIIVNGVTYYADFNADNVRSLRQVAELAAADYPDNAFIQAIANS